MSNWTIKNIAGQANWDDVQATWDDVLATWDALDTPWTNQSENSSTYTLQSKNTVAPIPSAELLIDDTHSLLIESPYVLLVQSEVAGYSLQAENTATYTLQPRGNEKITTQVLLIDSTHGLLIDDNHLLEIQSNGIAEDWQLQSKN